MTIFISHNHTDDLFVDKLRSALRQRGFQIWVDHHDVPIGTIWDHIVEQKLTEAQVMLLIMSHSSVSSIKVRAEWYEFQEMGKRIIPIRVDDCRPPLLIRQLQQLDFSKSELFDEQLERLIRELPPVVTREMEYTEDELAIREMIVLASRSDGIIQKQLQSGQIALVFPELQKQYKFDLKSEKFIIGWHDRAANLKPDIDLTNYGAVGKGVSRQHAMLVKTATELMIIDLSSRNGTRIDGLHLPMEKPMPLKNKAVLHLADLAMFFFIKE